MEMPKRVEVTFNLNGMGITKEIYDMFCVNDLACWRVNASTYMQIKVDVLTHIIIDDKRKDALNRLLRFNRFKARKLGLSLK